MNSVGSECGDLKKSYDDCFNKWFAEKFLKGDTREDGVCKEFFIKYQSCIKKSLKEQNINYEEIEKDVMGTTEEKQPPKTS
ncbi:TP53-regulated inhibitor of apoptosis 1 [Armadillidium nasatum]|uniref:TP53-regulated inhibitor of apoptosis 1 n=1 Tax=Armadillidium nasatum TaxID=96803 RepID=A0A5N5TBX4_9CRUS|nr:TP53-regulated inhibitor of apoptosis 1 [Armadillidium nasatum]